MLLIICNYRESLIKWNRKIDFPDNIAWNYLRINHCQRLIGNDFVIFQEMRQLCTWILLLLTIVNLQALEKLKIIYSWKSLDFVFPSEHARLTAIKSGNFIPGSPLPIDVDVYNGGNKKDVIFSSSKYFSS